MREEQVFAALLEIDNTYKPVLTSNYNLLSTDNRRAIMKDIRINKNNLSKYIASLINKGIIVNIDETRYKLNDTFRPITDENQQVVKFILELEEDE